MRILILTQIFLPEMGALSNRLYPIVRRLVASGHEVFVATGMPNYPAGKVFPEYRGKLFTRENIDDYTVLRTAYYTVPRNKSKLSQLLSYLSFIPAVLLSGLRAGQTDVVFITAPPPFPILPAILLAKLRGARLILDVRDLWSDELITYGGVPPGSPGHRLIRAIEQLGYRFADRIGCTTESLSETVVERGAAREKTFYFPNGADLEIFRPLPADNPIAASFGLGDRFVVMYSGLFGIKHGLEVLLEAARLLRDRKDIVFLLLGNGARRDTLRQYVEDNGLDNVVLADERRVAEIPFVLARADVCFAACRPEPYPKKLISVKIFEYLACEKPVIASLEGESARVVEESGGGLVVAPGSGQAVADAILELYQDPERRAAMGRAGRRYVEENYSRTTWAARFEEMLHSLQRPRLTRSEKKVVQAGVSIPPPQEN